MNINRKIQLAAAAITCSGAALLGGLLSPPVAVAGTCISPKIVCTACQGMTQTQRDSVCRAVMPSGCTTYLGAVCYFPVYPACEGVIGGPEALACGYQ
jgi:hypothetical protein